ncbi:MAG: histidine phosphatase family protein [Oscillospiraceae bacterium]|nr:histidine phosphatase family protein [Oscillospiraceae bacterium]
MRLLFIRHGEPDYGNDCLTETGHIQAQRCAERLKSEGIDLIFSSSMGRARQTAQYTADILGKDIQILDYMHEIVWGHEGVRDYHHDDSPWVITDRMAAEDGDLLDAGWAEGRWFSGNKCVENVRMIAEETDAFLAELGHVREGRYYRNTTGTDDRRTIALFAHGGSSSAAIDHILGLPFPFVCASIHMDVTSISILRFEHRSNAIGIPVMELINDVGHLR